MFSLVNSIVLINSFDNSLTCIQVRVKSSLVLLDLENIVLYVSFVSYNLWLLTFFLHPTKGKAQMTREHSFQNKQGANSQSQIQRKGKRKESIYKLKKKFYSACLPCRLLRYVFSLISTQNKHWAPDPAGQKHSQHASNSAFPPIWRKRSLQHANVEVLGLNPLFSLFPRVSLPFFSFLMLF